METEPKITLVSDNNVEVIHPKIMTDTLGNTFETFDHSDPSLKENLGTAGVTEKLDKLTERLLNWQDQAWVDAFVANQIASLQKSIATYQLVDTKLKSGELTPKG